MDAVAEIFRAERSGKHGTVVKRAIEILRARFATSKEIQGYRKDGPVAVAKFELGESEEPALREARALRQREASDVSRAHPRIYYLLPLSKNRTHS
jgi:hypothetical protein